MATIERYEAATGRTARERTRYRVRYRKPDGRQTRKTGFRTKAEAEMFLHKIEEDKRTGVYVDPTRSRTTVGALAKEWLAYKSATVKPSTYQTYRSRWNHHVAPRWEKESVSKVSVKSVRNWIAELTIGRPAAEPPVKPLSASLIADCFTVLSGAVDLAVEEKLLPSNPLRGKVDLPARTAKRKTFLTHADVKRLAEASTHPEIIYTLAYTGMRWGELTALRVHSIDQNRRRISIDSSITTLRDGQIYEGPPKSGEARTLVYPQFLAPIFAQQCARKAPTDYVFMSPNGGVLRPPSSQTGWFATAVNRVGLGQLSPHDLRHTAASLAVSAGANVLALQRMLGHESAAMTLDRYSVLFDEDLARVADALDDAVAREA